MLLPRVTVQRSGLRDTVTTDFSGGIIVERRMRTRTAVVNSENFELPLQLDGIPEQRLVKKLPVNGADYLGSAWPKQFGDYCQQVCKQQRQVLNGG